MAATLEFGLALGTNLGDKRAHLQQAIRFLSEAPFQLVKVSAYYTTEPWGFTSEHQFMNACALVQTDLLPMEVLKKVKAFEESMGRKKRTGEAYTDRVIDIDILFCGNQVIFEEGLTVPHPHLHQRAFVLTPLNEICPDWEHPILKKTVKELLEEVGSK